MQDQLIIETSGDKRYRVRLEVDEGASNPREDYDQIVYAVTLPNSRYADIAEAGPLVDGWDRIKGYRTRDAVRLFERWARIFHGAVTLYDTPHEGASAIWYILPAQIAEIGGTPREALTSYRDEYRSWVNGEVYAYIIEEAVDWRRLDDKGDDRSTWERIDDESSGSLIGYGYAEEEAKQAFANFLAAKATTV